MRLRASARSVRRAAATAAAAAGAGGTGTSATFNNKQEGGFGRLSLCLGSRAAQCERDGLRAAVDAELGQDPLDVRRNRLRTDEERLGDRVLIGTAREEVEYLAFARRQPVDVVAVAVYRCLPIPG